MLPIKKDTPYKISLKRYVQNPAGKGTGHVGARYRIINSLNASFINLLRKARRSFTATPYIYPDGRILFIVGVPSEVFHDKVVFNVLIEFEANEKIGVDKLSLRNVRFFSNSPAFIFTYAYVYYHKDLTVPATDSLFENITLTRPPKVRNPLEELGFEKSTYIAARYLIDGNCLTQSYLRKHGVKMTPHIERQIVQNIPTPKNVLNTYRHKLKNQKKENTRSRRLIKPRSSGIINNAEKSYIEKKDNLHKILPKNPRSKITAKKAKTKIAPKKATKKSRTSPKSSLIL